MALKLKVKTLDEVPEAARAAYVAQGDSFVLDVEDAADLSKLPEFRESNRTMHGELERWKALGLTPEQAKQAVADARKKKSEDQSAADLKKDFEAQLEAAKTENEKKLAELRAKVDRYEILEPMRQAATKAGMIATEIDDVLELPSVRSRYRRGEDGTLEFVGPNGKPILDMTAEKFFEQMRKDRPRFFEPTNAGGSASAPSVTTIDGKQVKQINASDQENVNANLEAIAAGTVVVGAG